MSDENDDKCCCGEKRVEETNPEECCNDVKCCCLSKRDVGTFFRQISDFFDRKK